MYDSYNFVTIKVRENKGQEINENHLQYTLTHMEMELRYMGQPSVHLNADGNGTAIHGTTDDLLVTFAPFGYVG